MRVSLFATAAALVLPLSVAAPAVAAPIEDDGVVACVYNGVRSADPAVLLAVASKGFDGEGSEEQRVVQQVGAQLTRCRGLHGWGRAREAAALRYLSGMAMTAEAVKALEPYGVTAEMFESIHEALDPASRDAFVNGTVTAEQSRQALEVLAAAGVTLDSIPAEAHAGFGAKVGQGVAGRVVTHHAIAQYND